MLGRDREDRDRSLGMVQQGRARGGDRCHRDRVTITIPAPPAAGVLPARGPEVEPAVRVMTAHPPKLPSVDHQGAMGIAASH